MPAKVTLKGGGGIWNAYDSGVPVILPPVPKIYYVSNSVSEIRIFDADLVEQVPISDITAHAIACDRFGNLYVYVTTPSYRVIKFDAEGEQVWTSILPNFPTLAPHMECGPEGELVLTAEFYDPASGAVRSGVCKIQPTGETGWLTYSETSGSNKGSSVSVAANGDAIYTNTNGAGDFTQLCLASNLGQVQAAPVTVPTTPVQGINGPLYAAVASTGRVYHTVKDTLSGANENVVMEVDAVTLVPTGNSVALTGQPRNIKPAANGCLLVTTLPTGSDTNTLFLFDAELNLIWKLEPPSGAPFYNARECFNGFIYAAELSYFIHKIDPATGEIVASVDGGFPGISVDWDTVDVTGGKWLAFDPEDFK